ncbi:flagellar hook-associated protein FlgK [Rhodobacteraceae bacterium KMM 6894]|nr:flagellar hook-associated protein FlgK [Rhodobacteraceae bacterium KMM 6894]
MSISSALSNALSGLTANSRAVSVVASNLANLQTEGYGRRDIALESDRNGGVRVTGTTRHVDQAVLSDLRSAGSDIAYSETRAQFLGNVQMQLGTPDQAGSLPARIAALEASLITASSRPEATDRLHKVALRANEVTSGFTELSDSIQSARMTAEDDIAQGVRTLNMALGQVKDLNSQILNARQGGVETSSLLDQRQVVIDRIAEFIPVREVPRDNGAVALMTPGGAMLVDGPAATLEFTKTNLIAPHMTLDNGLLSGLSINGIDVASSGSRSPIAGGRLSALFEVRDTLSVDAQTQVDALARDMISRFQDVGVDPTLGGGAPGLFTDAGAVFDATNEVGIAGRMELNALVDPGQSAEFWRLRDGLAATSQGPEGNGVLLGAMSDALSARNVLSSGAMAGSSGSTAQHVAALVSRTAQNQLAQEQVSSFTATRQSELQERLSLDGVDSDAETQRLLLIEQAYSANARMIQTLDEMMQTLLRI